MIVSLHTKPLTPVLLKTSHTTVSGVTGALSVQAQVFVVQLYALKKTVDNLVGHTKSLTDLVY